MGADKQSNLSLFGCEAVAKRFVGIGFGTVRSVEAGMAAASRWIKTTCLAGSAWPREVEVGIGTLAEGQRASRRHQGQPCQPLQRHDGLFSGNATPTRRRNAFTIARTKGVPRVHSAIYDIGVARHCPAFQPHQLRSFICKCAVMPLFSATRSTAWQVDPVRVCGEMLTREPNKAYIRHLLVPHQKQSGSALTPMCRDFTVPILQESGSVGRPSPRLSRNAHRRAKNGSLRR